MLHKPKVSGSYSLKSSLNSPTDLNVAEEIRNYFHITFGFLTRVLVFVFFQECICFRIRINSESVYHFLVISFVWWLILFFTYFYVRDKLRSLGLGTSSSSLYSRTSVSDPVMLWRIASASICASSSYRK